MKTIWKVIAAAIAVGLILSILGFLMGASRVLYLDRTGIHISGSGVSHITEMDLDGFKNIYVDAGFSDVEFIRSDRFGIDLFGDSMEWVWALENDFLRISHTRDSRIQIMNLDFVIGSRNYAKIYIPEGTDFETVTVKTRSGDIRLGNFNADKVEVSTSFGDANVSNITSNQMHLTFASGDITISNVDTGTLVYNNRFGDGRFQNVNAESFRSDINSGELRLTDCMFDDLGVSGSFGDIIANGLTSRKTNIRTNSGDVRVAGDFTGETAIHTSFGDVRLTTSGAKEDYSFDISVRFGSIRYDGERLRDQRTHSSGTVLENHLKITTSSGDVNVIFER